MHRAERQHAAMELHLERIPHSVELVDDGGPLFKYIDQRLLPGEMRVAQTRDWREVIDAIKNLAVRGAPAIGLAGAAAMALWACCGGADCNRVAEEIATARPTAVNLRWAVQRSLDEIDGVPAEMQAERLIALVKSMEDEDIAANHALGQHGAALLGANACILTHCNAGSLATCHFGTALGVVYTAARQGKIERVYADETRPVGQGVRLTAWELSRAGVPVTLICDNMPASLMAQGVIDAVIVGADRIARNGDTANKIGTYGLAVLAKEHGIPFYIAAPFSTIDPTLADGSGIVIEQRAPSEVLSSPIEGVDVWNPAFDVTPARYISKIVTEKGAFSPEELASRL